MLLELEDVHVHYGAVAALRGISFTVEEGEIVALLGANGAGKTTTLKTISGVRPLTSGVVRFEGEDIRGVPAHRRVEMGICQAPEGRGIFPGMSVTENLEMGAYTRKGSLDADFERVFELFPRLHERRRQPGGTLSGGEQQMLAIGRALMAHPQLLLLDEPSNHLDLASVRHLEQALAGYGGALIVASHDPAFLEAVGCDATWALTRGGLVSS